MYIHVCMHKYIHTYTYQVSFDPKSEDVTSLSVNMTPLSCVRWFSIVSPPVGEYLYKISCKLQNMM